MGSSPAAANVLCLWARHFTSIASFHTGDNEELYKWMLRVGRIVAPEVMQHGSDDSSVPAYHVDQFGIKPLGFNGYPVYLCCI